jgi:hypothetical protein
MTPCIVVEKLTYNASIVPNAENVKRSDQPSWRVLFLLVRPKE